MEDDVPKAGGVPAVFGWKPPKTLSFKGFAPPMSERVERTSGARQSGRPLQTLIQQTFGQDSPTKPNFIETARSNPGVQKIVSGVNEWESQVRNAQKRIATSFDQASKARPAQRTPRDRKAMSPGFTRFAEESQLIQKVEQLSTGFKRSISESDFLKMREKKKAAKSLDFGDASPAKLDPELAGPPTPPSKPGMRRVGTADQALQNLGSQRGESPGIPKPIQKVGSWLRDATDQPGEQAKRALMQYQENAKRNAAAVQQYIRGVLPPGLATPGDVAPGAPWSFLPGLREPEPAQDGQVTSVDGGKRLGPFGGGARKRGRGQRQERRQGARSIRDDDRKFAIVTTAALPWMTGTAVNPLLRAAYLSQTKKHVTLLVPWLCKEDQQQVYPNKITFETPEQQEVYVRDWVKNRVGFEPNFKLRFYASRYAVEKGSILPVGDLTSYIPDGEADVAVLEEPEHLNWYHHGRRWSDKFQHVVGIVHTNYLEYVKREENGEVKEKVIRQLNNWMCRNHCHKVVKLSGAVQELPRSVIEYVHGVSIPFLAVGDKKGAEAAARGAKKGGKGGEGAFKGGCYFLGKVVWGKGYTELLDMMAQHGERHGHSVPVDVYGSGPDLGEVEERSSREKLPLKFHGAIDHISEKIHEYRVFVNPSLSDVVATTTAEALAMGKWVVVAEHPSNDFFSTFPNCLVYRNPSEFSSCLERAMSEDPTPLRAEDRHRLTWEAATERFMQVAEEESKLRLPERVMDATLARAHNMLMGSESVRVAVGAGAGTMHAPKDVTEYRNLGGKTGFLDSKTRVAKKIDP